MLMEARIRDLEVGIARQLDAISARLDALARDGEDGRKASFEELARSIHELGDRIGGISKR
jgi:uncharacterized coiled-coil protein SlyX